MLTSSLGVRIVLAIDKSQHQNCVPSWNLLQNVYSCYTATCRLHYAIHCQGDPNYRMNIPTAVIFLLLSLYILIVSTPPKYDTLVFSCCNFYVYLEIHDKLVFV